MIGEMGQLAFNVFSMINEFLKKKILFWEKVVREFFKLW